MLHSSSFSPNIVVQNQIDPMDAADARNFGVGDIVHSEVDGFRRQVDEIFLKVDRVKH